MRLLSSPSFYTMPTDESFGVESGLGRILALAGMRNSVRPPPESAKRVA